MEAMTMAVSKRTKASFTHLDRQGKVRMVDVGAKPETERAAVATGTIRMAPEAIARLRRGEIAKGNVLTVAKAAGVMAAKRTADLIPLCHPLLLEHVEIEFAVRRDRVDITSSVRLRGKTGAEMEALTAVAVAALTIYDMCKAVDRGMEIDEVRLLEKRGGRSGHYRRTEAAGRSKRGRAPSTASAGARPRRREKA
jgi:cyclic pyranopterin phosphate synthase